MVESITIKTPFLKAIAWGCIAFFLLCSMGSLFIQKANMCPIFLSFVALGIFMVLMSGKAEITSNGFTALLPIGRYYIAWEEVEYVETGAGNLVFGNKHKRVCFPSFEFWNGCEKEKALKFIDKVLQNKNLEVIETRRAVFPIYKNTRVH